MNVTKTMEYTEDPEVLREWTPLMMKGRDATQRVAATRVAQGTDVNFAAVSRGMIRHLNTLEGFELQPNTSAIDLEQEEDKSWTVTVRHETNHSIEKSNVGFLFVGAGGATLPLQQKSGIPEKGGGKLEFGTEVIQSEDGTLAAMLGALPGASILVPVILEIIETCFADQLATKEWHTKSMKTKACLKYTKKAAQ